MLEKFFYGTRYLTFERIKMMEYDPVIIKNRNICGSSMLLSKRCEKRAKTDVVNHRPCRTRGQSRTNRPCTAQWIRWGRDDSRHITTRLSSYLWTGLELTSYDSSFHLYFFVEENCITIIYLQLKFTAFVLWSVNGCYLLIFKLECKSLGCIRFLTSVSEQVHVK